MQSVTSRPCTAMSSGISCRQPRFHFTEHPTRQRWRGGCITWVVSCRQFGTYVLSVSSLGRTYTMLEVPDPQYKVDTNTYIIMYNSNSNSCKPQFISSYYSNSFTKIFVLKPPGFWKLGHSSSCFIKRLKTATVVIGALRVNRQ